MEITERYAILFEDGVCPLLAQRPSGLIRAAMLAVYHFSLAAGCKVVGFLA